MCVKEKAKRAEEKKEPSRTILLLFFFFCSGFVVFCLIFLNFSISGRFIFIFFLFSILSVLRYRYVLLLLSKSNYNLLNCGPLDEAPGSSNAIKYNNMAIYSNLATTFQNSTDSNQRYDRLLRNISTRIKY